MFLDVLSHRNREPIDAAIMRHRAGQPPAGTRVLDLDAIEAYASVLAGEATRLGLLRPAATRCIELKAGAVAPSAGASLDRLLCRLDAR